MEPSDVVVECAKLAIGGEPDRPREEGRGSSRTSQDFTNTFGKSHTVLKLNEVYQQIHIVHTQIQNHSD